MEFKRFKILSGLNHGVTHRLSQDEIYGGFNLATHVGDDANRVGENRRRLANLIGVAEKQLIFANQTHSSNVALVEADTNNEIDNTDALITNVQGLCLNVLTADCVPLLFYDPRQRAIGVVHAGWKGTAGEISLKTALAMQQAFGTKMTDLLVAIGPCISQDVYEVGEEVAVQFAPDCLMKLDEGKYKLDLVQANVNQLIGAGVKKAHIEVSNSCTFQSKEYYSARREGIRSGRFSSFIML